MPETYILVSGSIATLIRAKTLFFHPTGNLQCSDIYDYFLIAFDSKTRKEIKFQLTFLSNLTFKEKNIGPKDFGHTSCLNSIKKIEHCSR